MPSMPIDNQTKQGLLHQKKGKEGIGKSCARWSNVYRAYRVQCTFKNSKSVLIVFLMKNVLVHEVMTIGTLQRARELRNGAIDSFANFSTAD